MKSLVSQIAHTINIMRRYPNPFGMHLVNYDAKALQDLIN